MTATTVNGDGAPESREAGRTAAKIAVWDLPTRIFHWSLAASFALAFLSAESERWRDVHVMLGYTVLGLIAFRLAWGLIGSRYARFSSFAAGPSRIAAYAKSLLAGRPQHYVGHNPAGALAIFLLLGCGLLVGISGYASFNELAGEWPEDLHEGAANAMLAVVAIHVLGVIVSSVMHRENLVGAMITGNKHGRPEEGIVERYRALGIFLLLTVLGFWGAWSWNSAALRPAAGGGETVSVPAADGGKFAGPGRRHDDDD